MTTSTSRLTSHCSSWRVELETISMLMSGYRSLIARRFAPAASGQESAPRRSARGHAVRRRRGGCPARDARPRRKSRPSGGDEQREIRRPRLAAAAIEEARAELVLEMRDPVAQRRLGDTKDHRSLAQASRLADHLDVQKVSNVHVMPLANTTVLIRKLITTCESLLFHASRPPLELPTLDDPAVAGHAKRIYKVCFRGTPDHDHAEDAGSDRGCGYGNRPGCGARRERAGSGGNPGDGDRGDRRHGAEARGKRAGRADLRSRHSPARRCRTHRSTAWRGCRGWCPISA